LKVNRGVLCVFTATLDSFIAGFIWPSTVVGSSHCSITWVQQTSMPPFMGR